MAPPLAAVCDGMTVGGAGRGWEGDGVVAWRRGVGRGWEGWWWEGRNRHGNGCTLFPDLGKGGPRVGYLYLCFLPIKSLHGSVAYSAQTCFCGPGFNSP